MSITLCFAVKFLRKTTKVWTKAGLANFVLAGQGGPLNWTGPTAKSSKRRSSRLLDLPTSIEAAEEEDRVEG